MAIRSRPARATPAPTRRLARTDSIARAEKLCRDIAANRFVQNELEVQLTISIGACLVNPPAKLVNLMTLADAALYEAKNHGRNQVVVTESQPG